MKKILFFILLIIAGIICSAQNQQTSSNQSIQNYDGFQTHVDMTGKSYAWEKVGEECSGCASYYSKIMRSTNKDEDGYYNYFIFFYSNSFDRSGYLTYTYLVAVVISYQDFQGDFQPFDFHEYVLIKPKNGESGDDDYFDGVQLVSVFQSVNPGEVIKISWGDLSIY